MSAHFFNSDCIAATRIYIIVMILTTVIMLFLSSLVIAQETGLATRPTNLTCLAVESSISNDVISFEDIITSISGTKSIELRFMPEEPEIAALVSNSGVIYRYEKVEGTNGFERSNIMLDIEDQVTREFNGTSSAEMGLLGFAFHPNFETNGYAYLYYSAVGTVGQSKYEARLARFQSMDGGVSFERNSEEVLLRLDHSARPNHWGGSILFDSKGYLYLTLGDASVSANSQDLTNVYGKVIRIDPDSDFPYGIPPDNPFVDVAEASPEIYAMGFRNPWRASFDKETGDYWVGDVGHVSWEEINLVEKGANYGWPVLEGPDCFNSDTCVDAGFVSAQALLSHEDETSAIIGGFVYRGTDIPELIGKYIFGDVTTGNIWVLSESVSTEGSTALLGNAGSGVFSFAEDVEGELYVVGRHAVRKIVKLQNEPDSLLPRKLSETGCFLADNPAEPAPGLIPYGVNSPLWSDGASKSRWIALPDWDKADTKIEVDENGDWTFPPGTVLLKSFSLEGVMLETRFLSKQLNGQWSGRTYAWNDEQTDAVLVDDIQTILLADGTEWTIPSRTQCFICHTENAGVSLGLETAQLNGDYHYQSTDTRANQIATLDHIGLFKDEFTESIGNMPQLAVPLDVTSGTLELRSRAYLHANCAMCHLPGGDGQGRMDFRFHTSLSDSNIINELPSQSNLGIEDVRIITPGEPERSVLLHRVSTRGNNQMPPLGTQLVDRVGAELLEEWILSMSDDSPELPPGVSQTDNDHDDLAESAEIDASGSLDSDIESDNFEFAIDNESDESAKALLRTGTGSWSSWQLTVLFFLLCVITWCPVNVKRRLG